MRERPVDVRLDQKFEELDSVEELYSKALCVYSG